MPLQRDRLGRFIRGNHGGPGRPKGKRDPAYMDIVAEVVSYDDWRAMIDRVKRYALGSDIDFDAVKFLAPYLLGRPPSAAPIEDEIPDPVPATKKQNRRPVSPSARKSQPAKE